MTFGNKWDFLLLLSRPLVNVTPFIHALLLFYLSEIGPSDQLPTSKDPCRPRLLAFSHSRR